MKKKLAFVAASALAVSAVAVTAPAPADAAVTTAQPGFYDTTTNTYYTVAQFQSLTQAQKKALVKDGVYLYTGENVISAKDAVLSTNEQLQSKYIAPADFNAADLDAIYAASVTSPPVTGEFKVESVSAINGTQVEVTFNKAPETAPKAADFTIEGLEVKSVNAKAGSTTTFVLTTSAQEAGKEYTLAYGEQSKTFVAVVQVSKLEAATTSYAQQVGKEVTVEYKVLDQAGKPVAGKEVYVRAGLYSDNAQQPAIEKTLTSDENGVVKFTYTRNEAFTEAITAYVVDQPLVREANVKVNWTVSDTSRLTVEASKQGELGHNTIVEYTINAKDADNKDLAKGEEIKLGFTYANGTDDNVSTVKVEQKLANGTWKEIGTNSSTNPIELLEAGKATVRVIFGNPTVANKDKSIEVVPKFTYENNSTKEEDQSVAIAPALKFVPQKAVLTLEAVTAGNEVAYNKTKEYTLTAKDQFGNPFRGVVTLDALENADGLSSTDPAADYVLSIDSDGDEVFEKLGNTKIAVDFAFGEDDKINEDGQVIVRVDNDEKTTTNELTLAAFVDANGDGYISTNEANAKAEKVKFGQAGPASIQLESKSTSVSLNGGSVGSIDYAVTLVDKDGKEVKPTTPVVFKVQKYNKTTKTWSDDTNAIISIKKDNAELTTDPAVATFASGKYTILKAESKYAKVTVTPGTTPAANDEYRLVVFADGGKKPDGALQTDEISATSEFSVEGALLSKGELTVTSPSSTTYAEGSALNTAVAAPATSADTVSITYKYDLKDQSDKNFTTNTKVTWTVTNNTDGDIEVPTGQVGLTTKVTLAKGETKSFSVEVTSADTTSLNIEATGKVTEGQVVVKAQASVAGTLATQTTYLYKANKIVTVAATRDTAAIYTGTISSFNFDTNGDKDIKGDGNFLVVSAGTVGDILVNNITPAQITYVVEGNTADEATFEKVAKVGSTVTVEQGTDGKVKITLK